MGWPPSCKRVITSYSIHYTKLYDLKIDDKECTRCMHCINVMPRALRIGEDRGLSMLVGAKAPILDGAQMGSLLVPFVKAEEPYDET